MLGRVKVRAKLEAALRADRDDGRACVDPLKKIMPKDVDNDNIVGFRMLTLATLRRETWPL